MELRIFLYEWIGCADPAAQMVYLEEVTLHARGEAGKPPFHGLRTRGEVWGGTRGDAWGPGFITKGRRYYIGTGRNYIGDAL